MLTTDVEVDPLYVKDPLDCVTDYGNSVDDEGPSKWAVLYEQEMVREVTSESLVSDVEVGTGRRLRVRKPRIMSDVGDCDDDDDDELTPYFKSEGSKKKGRRKKSRNVGSGKTGGRKKYSCNTCNKHFVTASQKENHLLSHHQRFPCEECGKIFSRLESLQKHLISGHTGEIDDDEDEEVESVKQFVDKKCNGQLKTNRKHHCLVCSKTFKTVSHLNAHMSCHSGKKWKCDGCGRNFSCERSLIRHRDTFPGEHWFPCQYCDMNFFRVENILKHLDIKHPEASLKARETGELVVTFNEKENVGTFSGSQIFVCTKCANVFHDVEGLRSHRETVHSCASESTTENGSGDPVGLNGENIPMYKCEICSKGFVSLEGFEYHRNNQHVEKNGKKSRKGKENFDQSDESDCDLEEIEEKKKDEKFDCNVCSEFLPTKSSLEVHVKTHISGKTQEVKAGIHQCCICPRSFASSDGLKYHLATHTGERRYSCSHCGKKFIKKTHLYEHVATHSQEKCFKCPRCPRTFSTHSAYRKHIKHFAGPHSFPCSKCGKLFTKESMLEKHMCVDLVKVTMAPEVKALLVEENGESQQIADNVSCEPATALTQELSVENRADEPSDKSHSCYKCFKVFPSLDQLQTHQYEHIGKQQYQCRFCPENFKRADDFSVHIRSHLGSSPYMCLKCNRKFISPLTLSMHAKKYPGDHSFTCSKCQRWFPSENKLDKHECILQNVESFACACGSAFKSWNEFQQHAGSKPYKCCSCDLKYLTLIALVRHIKKHTGVKPFSCDTCGKAFRAKSNYLHHIEIHKSAKEIQCEHCEFKSKSKKRMDFHLFRKHDIGSNTSSTLCPVCGIMFPYMTQVKKHIEMEHANEIVLEESKREKKALPTVLCTLCGKLLSNKYMLANHMKKVHDPDAQKNIQEYKCEVCDEKFRSKKRLARHMEVHEVPGLRKCEICSREFYYAKDLRKHMRRHDTNKPFSCPKCGKNFKVSVSLKYHSSICGNGNVIVRDDEKVSEENGFPTGHEYYGHVDPVNVKNVMYPVVSGYRKWM